MPRARGHRGYPLDVCEERHEPREPRARRDAGLWEVPRAARAGDEGLVEPAFEHRGHVEPPARQQERARAAAARQWRASEGVAGASTMLGKRVRVSHTSADHRGHGASPAGSAGSRGRRQSSSIAPPTSARTGSAPRTAHAAAAHARHHGRPRRQRRRARRKVSHRTDGRGRAGCAVAARRRRAAVAARTT